MKKCIMCGDSKSLSCYYKHKQMKDGHLNKCKECCKMQSKLREAMLRKDGVWTLKEQERHREKYRRLNYKDKQKEWDKDKVWKNTSTYKNLHRKLQLPKYIVAHHWNYFKLNDVVLMNTKGHRSLHKLLVLDIEKRIFKVKSTGGYLDTREKHLAFILGSGHFFIERLTKTKGFDKNLWLRELSRIGIKLINSKN